MEINDLPKNWVLKTLGDVSSHPQYGYTTKAADTGDIKLLRTTDITSGMINWDTVPFCLKNPDDIKKFQLEDGDIVVSRAGSIGVSYLVQNPEKSVFASYLIRFKPFINRRYFKYFLESPFYWVEISDNKSGIAVQNINAQKLKAIPLPIPPLNEQHRIVTKIEELFSKIDKGVESLQKAKELLVLYRQSLLKHAFEGKLTEQ
ncbi:MAG: restriction endonuclease subunit S, partial [Desulfamplus sp.]|nr:restriction endonuclease subunit S [Desulfamplus sp.]